MLFLLLIACAPEKEASPDGFRRHDAVRVLAPDNGETVESPFTLFYEAGADVAAVHLDADGAPVVASSPVEGELVVTLEPGSWRLSLVGEDTDGGTLSHHDLTVRISEPEASWVTLTSPADGAVVPNPVRFQVEASSDIDRVDVLADGFLLGSTTSGGAVTWEFSGTGYARDIEAQAWSGDQMLATDTLSVTVEAGTEPELSDFNALVLDLLEGYPTDGTNGYYWPEGDDWHGTTRDIWYLDTLVAEGDPEGRCYCVGLTWEVFMRAFDEADRATGGDGTLNGLTVDDLDSFRVDWFVRELYGAGPADGLELYGLGEAVSWADAQPGDFIQWWRHSGSGHNAIFIDWEYDDSGAIDGFTYWSTQSSTDGIDYNSEYFGSTGSSVDAAYFFPARPTMPADWIPWH